MMHPWKKAVRPPHPRLREQMLPNGGQQLFHSDAASDAVRIHVLGLVVGDCWVVVGFGLLLGMARRQWQLQLQG